MRFRCGLPARSASPAGALAAVVLLLVTGHLEEGTASAQDAPWERHVIELNSHSSVVIDAAAEVIWPLILKIDDWKQGLVLVTVDGALGERGTVHKAVLADSEPRADANAVYYVQDVELIENERRTLKLFLPAGPDGGRGSLLGFAAYVLEPAGVGKTKVSYHVYSESPLPPELRADSDAVARLEESSYRQNADRFQAELEVLKELVEGGER